MVNKKVFFTSEEAVDGIFETWINHIYLPINADVELRLRDKIGDQEVISKLNCKELNEDFQSFGETIFTQHRMRGNPKDEIILTLGVGIKN